MIFKEWFKRKKKLFKLSEISEIYFTQGSICSVIFKIKDNENYSCFDISQLEFMPDSEYTEEEAIFLESIQFIEVGKTKFTYVKGKKILIRQFTPINDTSKPILKEFKNILLNKKVII
ncbi:MAG: hypothetical protein ABIH28_04215 [archaeon]